jgi:hypothetical protein
MLPHAVELYTRGDGVRTMSMASKYLPQCKTKTGTTKKRLGTLVAVLVKEAGLLPASRVQAQRSAR